MYVGFQNHGQMTLALTCDDAADPEVANYADLPEDETSRFPIPESN